jgi:hypothetical protein
LSHSFNETLSFELSKSKSRHKDHKESNWSEDLLFLFTWSQREVLPIGVIVEPRILVHSEHIVQSWCNKCLFGVHHNYKPCHIPLKYGCPIKKSDHIRLTSSTLVSDGVVAIETEENSLIYLMEEIYEFVWCFDTLWLQAYYCMRCCLDAPHLEGKTDISHLRMCCARSLCSPSTSR